jgi:hypothetical protein
MDVDVIYCNNFFARQTSYSSSISYWELNDNMIWRKGFRHNPLVLFLAAFLVAMQFWYPMQFLTSLPSPDMAGFQPLNNPSDANYRAAKTEEIRVWGCDRTETPLIFVHVGKAGGGSIRVRLAASSLNYSEVENPLHVDVSYYPMSNTSKAHFCNSCSNSHFPGQKYSFEGSTPCNASTPIGHAIACPNSLKRLARLTSKTDGECGVASNTCRVVYAGHNYVGAEMHWLPVPFLQNWWNSHWSSPEDHISPLWNKLHLDRVWCDAKNMSRPATPQKFLKTYEQCSVPLQGQVDAYTLSAVGNKLGQKDATTFSPLYASLPVLRVTIMRDPFTWLMSKYVWSLKPMKENVTCQNLEEGVDDSKLGIKRAHTDLSDDIKPGWIRRMCLNHIIHLCGEDCMVRFVKGTATLQDLESQAEGNLRHAFAVVGILEEVETFYEMLSARISYIDTSLNKHVQGPIHTSSLNGAWTTRCQNMFSKASVQEWLLANSPELAVLHRLYKVAMEVNRSQLEDLRSCSSLPLGRRATSK